MQLVRCQPHDPSGHIVEGDSANKVRHFALKVQQLAKGPRTCHGALGNRKSFALVTLEGLGDVVVRNRIHVVERIRQGDTIQNSLNGPLSI